MSRGGRGGGRGGRGGMRANPLPFEVDLELVNGADDSVTDTSDENKAKQLFPPIELVAPGPVTSKERKQLAIYREQHANRPNSIFWTGTKEQILAYDGAKGKGRTALDAFDGMETYGKRKRAKPDTFVPPEKRKFPKLNTEQTPISLLPGTNGTKKKASAKKSVSDRLAGLDDTKDDDADADDGSDTGTAKNPDDDDAGSEPQDSDFSEDEADDADNDYNAENYFSGGEGDDGSIGGEEADDGPVAGRTSKVGSLSWSTNAECIVNNKTRENEERRTEAGSEGSSPARVLSDEES